MDGLECFIARLGVDSYFGAVRPFCCKLSVEIDQPPWCHTTVTEDGHGKTVEGGGSLPSHEFYVRCWDTSRVLY